MPLDESEGEMCWIKYVTENVLDKVCFLLFMDRYAWRSTFPPPAQRTNLTSKLCCLRQTALHTSRAVASYPPYFAEVLVNDCQCEITVCLTCSLSAHYPT